MVGEVGTVVVVVVVDVEVEVDEVGGGAVEVVVVVVGGGALVAVGLPPVPATVLRGGENVHMAVAQSCGWEATTTSTPGSVLNDQTFSGGPLWRHTRAGSFVVTWLTVPRYTAVPSEAGGVTAVSGTVAVFHSPVVANPEPTGPGVVVVELDDADALVLVGPEV